MDKKDEIGITEKFINPLKLSVDEIKTFASKLKERGANVGQAQINLLNIRLGQLNANNSDTASIAEELGIQYQVDYTDCWEQDDVVSTESLTEMIGIPRILSPDMNPYHQIQNLIATQSSLTYAQEHPTEFAFLTREVKPLVFSAIARGIENMNPQIPYSTGEKEKAYVELESSIEQMTVLEEKYTTSSTREKIVNLQLRRNEIAATFTHLIETPLPDFAKLTVEQMAERDRLRFEISGFDIGQIIFSTKVTDNAYAAFHHWRKEQGYPDVSKTKSSEVTAQFIEWKKKAKEAEILKDEEEYSRLRMEIEIASSLFTHYNQKDSLKLVEIKNTCPTLFEARTMTPERQIRVIGELRKLYPSMSNSYPDNDLFLLECAKTADVSRSAVTDVHESIIGGTNAILFIAPNYSKDFLNGQTPASAEVTTGPFGHDQALVHYMTNKIKLIGGAGKHQYNFPFPPQSISGTHIEMPYQEEDGSLHFVSVVLITEGEERFIDPDCLENLDKTLNNAYYFEFDRQKEELGLKNKPKISKVSIYSVNESGQLHPLKPKKDTERKAKMTLVNKKRMTGNFFMFS